MIRSYRGKFAAKIVSGRAFKGFPADLVRGTLQKLVILDNTGTLEDLRTPPGNRLEALKGNRTGQHSIRINDQWRICFVWKGTDAWDVEVTDYH